MKRKLTQNTLTFEEGFNLFLRDCRIRNLRAGTLDYYDKSYKQIIKFFSPDMPISDFTKEKFQEYKQYLLEKHENTQTVNVYLKTVIVYGRFLQKEGYISTFAMEAVHTKWYLIVMKNSAAFSLSQKSRNAHLANTKLG